MTHKQSDGAGMPPTNNANSAWSVADLLSALAAAVQNERSRTIELSRINVSRADLARIVADESLWTALPNTQDCFTADASILDAYLLDPTGVTSSVGSSATPTVVGTPADGSTPAAIVVTPAPTNAAIPAPANIAIPAPTNIANPAPTNVANPAPAIVATSAPAAAAAATPAVVATSAPAIVATLAPTVGAPATPADVPHFPGAVLTVPPGVDVNDPTVRWYAVTVGRRVGVFPHWTSVGPYVIGVQGSTNMRYGSKAAADAAFYDAVRNDAVRIVNPMPPFPPPGPGGPGGPGNGGPGAGPGGLIFVVLEN
ncbi:hypothetical protein BDN70DRAFT_901250 [Pholiota conissans]|uniref:Ribonuclease H1 N-terminal domain-containing protein n=1 Tax=Pholiota conissans TaxID=109636 RepID=A0A9P6CRX8_9AGAR|nr:hypothetical protein BDN70DRAFT_901250 [Pholiota conissans]